MSRVLRPTRLEDLWSALQEPGATVLAGGTDLLVWRRAGRVDPPVMVSLEGLPELRRVELEGDTLVLGAMETHGALLRSPWVQEHLPALIQALRVLGSPLVRASATLGGNLCTASPGGDTLPPLWAYGAELDLRSATGNRRLALDSFIRGPGLTALEPGEILGAIRVPLPGRFQQQHFEKVGRRTALACAVASFAALVRREGDDRVAEIRLAWGAVAPTVLRCPEAEARLLGTRLRPEDLREAAALAQKAAAPLTDVRASAAHRTRLVGNLLMRLGG